MSDLRNYTRWRRTELGDLNADLTPDEARLIGVRLIEAAALADGDRAIRETP